MKNFEKSKGQLNKDEFFKICQKKDQEDQKINSDKDSSQNSIQDIDLDDHILDDQTSEKSLTETTMSCSDGTKTISSSSSLKSSSSAKQSIMSWLTVHSRAANQLRNTHWQERLNERGNINLTDDLLKNEILNELKQIMMKHPDNIQ